MTSILAFVLIFLIFWMLYKNRFFIQIDVHPRILTGLLLCKLFAAFCLFIIYTKIYTDRSLADIFKYYDDGLVLFRVLHDNPKLFFLSLLGQTPDDLYATYSEMKTWFTIAYGSKFLLNDSRNIVRLNALLNFFSFGNYFLQSFYFTIIAFYGQLLIFRSLRKVFPHIAKLLLLSVCILPPSIIIWSSGILKEVILFLGIGLFLNALTSNSSKIKRAIQLLIAVFLLFSTKYYMIPCLLLAGIPFLYAARENKLLYLFKVILSISIAAGLFLCLPYFFPRLNIPLMLVKKHNDFYIHSLYMDANNLSYIGKYTEDFSSFINHIPKAFMNTIIQPFVSHIKNYNPPIILSLFENVIYLLLPIFALFKFNKSWNWKSHLSIAILVLASYTMIGLTTPVIGSIVRYKAPTLIFYITFFISLIKMDKLHTWINKIEETWSKN